MLDPAYPCLSRIARHKHWDERLTKVDGVPAEPRAIPTSREGFSQSKMGVRGQGGRDRAWAPIPSRLRPPRGNRVVCFSYIKRRAAAQVMSRETLRFPNSSPRSEIPFTTKAPGHQGGTLSARAMKMRHALRTPRALVMSDPDRDATRALEGTHKTSLPPSESGEFTGIDVRITEDLTQEASPDVLTLVDGDNRCPAILVLPERMAPLLSDQPKSQMGENCLQFTGGDGGETSHAGISSCWTPTRSKVGRDPPRLSRWTSSHSSAAS